MRGNTQMTLTQDEKKLMELQLKIINDFYITYRRKYLMMLPNASTITRSETLMDWSIKSHLLQKSRIGIKFGKGSKVIGLDLDTLDTDILNRTYQALLTFGLLENNILMTSSGNKGYHIDIFLDNFLSRDIITKFYKVLLWEVDANTREIEIRGNSDAGYYLPFSINLKASNNKDRHYGYCGIVNKYGVMEHRVTQNIEKLESLCKADTSIVNDIVSINYDYMMEDMQVTPTPPHEPTAKEDTDTKGLLTDALEDYKLLDVYNTSVDSIVKQISSLKELQPSTRHNIAFVYAIALRETGLTKQQVHNSLIEWHEQATGYLSSWNEVLYDCESITNSIFQVNTKGFRYNLASQNYEPYLTKQNLVEFAGVKSVPQRRIYIALAVHCNTFGDAQGKFYMTHKQINSTLGTNIKSVGVIKHIMGLEQLGLIEIVERGRRKKGNTKHEPNIYRLTQQQASQEQDKHYLTDSTINKQDVEDAIKTLFTDWEIRKTFKGIKGINKLTNCLSS